MKGRVFRKRNPGLGAPVDFTRRADMHDRVVAIGFLLLSDGLQQISGADDVGLQCLDWDVE